MRKKNEAYRKFIQSAEWRAIRKRYRESLPWVCFICGLIRLKRTRETWMTEADD